MTTTTSNLNILWGGFFAITVKAGSTYGNLLALCRPLPQSSEMPIYRAVELGEEDTKQTAPFPASTLGIFSCHGAEPGWEEGQAVGFSVLNVRPYSGRSAVGKLL